MPESQTGRHVSHEKHVAHKTRAKKVVRKVSAKKRLGNIGFGVLIIAIFVAAAYILAAPALDQADEKWVTCEAYSAKPISGGRSGESVVEISSSCGQIWFVHGVNRDNAAKIARKFTPHAEYDFQFGWLSRMYSRFGIPSPNAQAWSTSTAEHSNTASAVEMKAGHVNQTATIFLSLLIGGVAMAGITAFVSSRVRRGSTESARNATEAGVSFIVSARPWTSALLRWTGILFIVVGLVCLLIAIVIAGQEGAGIPGVIIALAGLVFVWIARSMKRARLEVTDDSVWVFRWTGTPRQVPVQEISQLAPLASNNYGGVVARSDKHRLFSASRLMLGYPQLIDYLHARRPDLPIPDASLPQ